MPLTLGLEATLEHVVTAADTAVALGSGDVDVLATPRLVALAEAASLAALRPGLEPGSTSVGTANSAPPQRTAPKPDTGRPRKGGGPGGGRARSGRQRSGRTLKGRAPTAF